MSWYKNAFFYHIYPLGFCDALHNHNQMQENKFLKINDQLDHIQSLGVNALFLGPIFSSEYHGYDTIDYYHVDNRLGSNENFKELVEQVHNRGMKIIIDGVFNHSGRAFWAFKDIQAHKWNSQYKDFYDNIRFDQNTHYNDGFSYNGWAGHMELVKYNLHNHEIKQHLLGAVQHWVREFDIDGLRLDAADVLNHDFMKELRGLTNSLKSDFFLKGEVVHGNYSQWLDESKLHSVTNYEAYKGLFSSHNDNNYHEIAHTLSRQFGQNGLYRDSPLYNFTENHDVNRLASNLRMQEQLYLTYGMLFTMPGIPSLYYGGEWGALGKRNKEGDHELRPTIHNLLNNKPSPELENAIRRFAQIRHDQEPLRHGDYQQLHVSMTTFAFERKMHNNKIIVAFNNNPDNQTITIPQYHNHTGYDLLNNEKINCGQFEISKYWLRIIKLD